MSKKPPSSRAYEHVSFNFGMVTIPLSVFTGVVSSHGIKRGMFTTVTKDDDTTEDHPVGYGNIDKNTGELVPPGQPVIKKVETEYGHVYVDDHEIEQLFEIDAKTITVKEFQPRHLFHQGHYVPKSLYYVEVTKTKVGSKKVENKIAQNNFALVLAAMKAHNAMAVVEFTTRGVPKPAVLLPDGTLWVLYHTDELREQRPLPEIPVPVEAANAAFEQYMKPLWGEQPLDLTDKRTELIQAFADEKAQAGDFGKSEEPAEAEVVASGGGMDLLAALSASVEQAKQQREVG
jgi:non-homologous end joining protein Ku